MAIAWSRAPTTMTKTGTGPLAHTAGTLDVSMTPCIATAGTTCGATIPLHTSPSDSDSATAGVTTHGAAGMVTDRATDIVRSGIRHTASADTMADSVTPVGMDSVVDMDSAVGMDSAADMVTVAATVTVVATATAVAAATATPGR